MSAPNKNSPLGQQDWMVRAAGRILGPFSFEEIAVGLKTKAFGLTDEVAKPEARWKLLRDEPEFFKVISEMRSKAEEDREGTQTSTMTLTQQTATIDLNATPSVSLKDFVNQYAKQNSAGRPDAANEGLKHQSSQVKDLGALLPQKPLKNGDLLGKVAAQGVNHNPKVEIQTNKGFSVFVWLLIVLGLAGGVWYWGQKQSIEKVNTQEEAYLKAMGYMSKGLNEKAYQELRGIRIEKKIDPKIELPFLTLQLSLEGNNSLLARKNLEQLLPLLGKKEDQVKAYTALSMAYLKENDLTASEAAITKALVVNPRFVPALINRGVFLFKKALYKDAEAEFSKILNLEPDSGMVLYAYILSGLELMRKGQDTELTYQLIIDKINDYLKSQFHLEQEFALIRAYAYSKLEQRQKSLSEVRNFLGFEWETGKKHAVDFLFDQSILSWNWLLPYCTALSLQFDQNKDQQVVSHSLLSFCGMRAGQMVMAEKEIKIAIEKAEAAQKLSVSAEEQNEIKDSPDIQELEAGDTAQEEMENQKKAKPLTKIYEMAKPDYYLAKSLKAQILISKDDMSETRAFIQNIFTDLQLQEPVVQPTPLLLSLRAKLCQLENQNECAIQMWNKLLEVRPRSLEAMHGLALLEFNRLDKVQSRKWISEAQLLSRTYLPLWELAEFF